MPGSNTSVRQRNPASTSLPTAPGRSGAIRNWWDRRSLRSTVAWPSPTSRPVRRCSSWAWKRRLATAPFSRRGLRSAVARSRASSCVGETGFDLVALVAAEGLLVGQLVPQGPVAVGDALGGGQVLVDPLAALAQLHGDVDQVAGDVLDQDVQVVGALAVAQHGVDLAGLGVDQERLEELAVA